MEAGLSRMNDLIIIQASQVRAECGKDSHYSHNFSLILCRGFALMY